MQSLVQAMQTQAHTQAALQAQLEAQPSLRMRLVAFDHRTLDEALSAACRQEGEMEQYLEEKKASQKRLAATFQRQDKKKAVYQTPQRSVAVGSSQRPQDQGLPNTSAGSPARSASPSGHSGSGASYRKTRKASSPSSSVCCSSRGRQVGGACHRRQLALESGIESEDLEVPWSVHTPAVLKLDPATCCIKELAGSSRKASPTLDYTGACSRTWRKAILEAGVVGDETLVEETLETDSERGD
ncbi:hypothetical protein Taro_003951 [Colocasia esculenta]|uniref:Uncharacterized protein n=1 Tax=Colocasia esculenta TaxID=4460 RepID=A0A843TQ94_COLES|nr:hypothetical protein [Colocasia esculenta]